MLATATNFAMPAARLAINMRSLLLTFLLCWLISACGGSGSAPGSTNGIPVTGNNTNTTPSTPKISLLLQNDVGAASSIATPAHPLTVKATLLDGNGAPLANTILEFSVGPNLAVLTPASGSVVTDAAGVASVKLQVKDAQVAQTQNGAADTVRVSAIVNEKTLSASAIFQIAPDTVTINNPVLSVSLVDARGLTSRTSSPDNPLTAMAKVVDANGAPLSDIVVSFSVDSQLSSTTPLSSSALTNSAGIASIVVAPKDALTSQNQAGAADTLRVAATVNGKSLTAQTVYQIGTPSGSNGSASMSMSLVDSKGVTSRIASLDSPITAQAKLVDNNNLPVANTIVTFSNNAALTTMTPSNGNALTNAEGVATVTVAPKDLQTANAQSGAADTLRASTSFNNKTVSASAVYQIGATASTTSSATLGLVLVDARGQTSTSITPGNPITARATLLDAKGVPIPNALVSFATAGVLVALAPASGATLTNSQGVASIQLSPKDLSTALSQAGTADTLSATATVGSNPLLASTNFQLGTTGVTLAMVAPTGGTTQLKAYDTSLIKVDVLVNGVVYTNDPISINFSSGCTNTGRASLPSSATTVNGRAQIVYTDKGCGGTDVVSASFAGAPTVNASLVIAPPVASSISFTSATPSDQAIVIKGAGGIGRSETATLTFTALDTAGKPLQNEVINFAVNATQAVTLQTTSATTDALGRVTANVNSGSLPTTFRVIASFASNPSISTISGVVTVSNGVPVQTAFSLSASSFNIEGFQIDNTASTVTILMADGSGNPVVDGTPVVFQTDSGAIGSSSNGGCITSNGGCSVIFRSQNPRYDGTNTVNKRAGLATISASTSTASVNITGQIGVFLSGSTAEFVYAGSSSSTRYSRSGVNFLSNASCGTYSLTLEVNDINANPMPLGTKISVVNPSADITIGTIIPSTVGSIYPHEANGNTTLLVNLMAARQGSVHTVPIILPVTCTAGINNASATFSVEIESPNGSKVSYPFNLPYRNGP